MEHEPESAPSTSHKTVHFSYVYPPSQWQPCTTFTVMPEATLEDVPPPGVLSHMSYETPRIRNLHYLGINYYAYKFSVTAAVMLWLMWIQKERPITAVCHTKELCFINEDFVCKIKIHACVFVCIGLNINGIITMTFILTTWKTKSGRWGV